MSRTSNKASTRARRHASETSRASDVRGHLNAPSKRHGAKQGA